MSLRGSKPTSTLRWSRKILARHAGCQGDGFSLEVSDGAYRSVPKSSKQPTWRPAITTIRPPASMFSMRGPAYVLRNVALPRTQGLMRSPISAPPLSPARQRSPRSAALLQMHTWGLTDRRTAYQPDLFCFRRWLSGEPSDAILTPLRLRQEPRWLRILVGSTDRCVVYSSDLL